MNSHDGFLSYLQNSTANSAHLAAHFCPVLVCPPKATVRIQLSNPPNIFLGISIRLKTQWIVHLITALYQDWLSCLPHAARASEETKQWQLQTTLEKTLIDTHYSLLQSILRLAVPDHVSQKIRKQLDSLQSEDSKNR